MSRQEADRVPEGRDAAAPSAERRTVADALAETLANFGARFAFGIPGGDVLDVMRACEARGIRYVLAKAEPSCAFMADAVYQLTGAPGVVIPALGPGVANMASGIAGAQQERSALAVLAGSVGRGLSGVYEHQVLDQVDLLRPVTKYAATLNPQRAAQQLARALDIAGSYPPGPVLLDIPADAARAATAEAAFAPQKRQWGWVLTERECAQIVARIKRAERPLALIGRGALFGPEPRAVEAFIRASGIPFMTSYKAKGVVSEYHESCLGALGLSPVVDAVQREVVDAADLLLPIGFDPIELREDWLDAWPADKAVITLDWAALNHRCFPIGQACYGDLHANLRRLGAAWGNAGAGGRDAATHSRHREWLERIVRPRDVGAGVSPAALFAVVSSQLTEEWLLTLDVGAHRILANHAIKCRAPNQLLQSNGLGCMGYAVPAAIAAQLVFPHRPVIALLGDGGMLMTLGELTAASDLNLPLVVVVLNDAALSLIRLKQSRSAPAPQGVTFRAADFARVAGGLGADGVTVTHIGQFGAALAGAVARRRFTVIDVLVDPAEYAEQM